MQVLLRPALEKITTYNFAQVQKVVMQCDYIFLYIFREDISAGFYWYVSTKIEEKAEWK